MFNKEKIWSWGVNKFTLNKTEIPITHTVGKFK